jgi:hypothetical protein
LPRPLARSFLPWPFLSVPLYLPTIRDQTNSNTLFLLCCLILCFAFLITHSLSSFVYLLSFFSIALSSPSVIPS